jgi:hypothetical protein
MCPDPRRGPPSAWPEFSLLFSHSLTFLPQGVIVRVWNFVQKYKDSTNNSGYSPCPLYFDILGRTKGRFLKSCPRVWKLLVWLLVGWWRCLEVTLQTHAPNNLRWCQWRAARRVKREQTRERGPPLAPAEFLSKESMKYRSITQSASFLPTNSSG